MQKGLPESLSGRFFLHRLGHWQFSEMSQAFGVSLDEWIYFGGYPGTVPFFEQDQLTDAGNTTTLAHYVRLLHTAFLLSGLELFKIGQRPKRGSSPKLVLWNNALANAVSGKGFEVAKSDSEEWGRLVDNAVGSTLINQLQGAPYELYPEAKPFIIGGSGMPLEEFFRTPLGDMFT